MKYYKIKNHICLFFAFFAFFIFAIAYMPQILNSSFYPVLIRIGFCLIGVALILNSINIIENIFKFLFSVAFLIGFILAAICALISWDQYAMDSYSIAVSFFAFLSGFCCLMNPIWVERIFKVYAVILSCIGFYIVRSSVGSFSIEAGYMVEAKNSICPLMAMAVVGLVFFITQQKKNIFNIIYIAFVCLLFADIMTARGRAALLAAVIVSTLIVIKSFGKLSSNAIIIYTLAFILMPIFIVLFQEQLIGLAGLFFESFTKNTDVYDLESLSSGRWESYKLALSAFFHNPISGANFNGIEDYSYIHNYLLRILASFGLIGGFTYIALWCMLWYYAVKNTVFTELKVSFSCLFNLGWYIMLVILIVSLFEPTFPFAPGSVVAIAFYLVGLSFFRRDMPC